MNYPLISEYIESIKYAEDNFATLTNLRPVLDDDGNPIMSSGNFAVVFKMKDYLTGKLHAVKCFLKEQEGRENNYTIISKELQKVDSPYILRVNYLKNELFVDTDQSDENEFPVILMDWVEGKTLSSYLQEQLYAYNDVIDICPAEEEEIILFELKCLPRNFIRMASWLLKQPFAHGDIKPDNIIVKPDGTFVLVDYDGMFVPSMQGMNKFYSGTPNYRNPLRVRKAMGKDIDDYAISVIGLSLCAYSIKPEMAQQNDEYCIISEEEVTTLYTHWLFKDEDLMMSPLFRELLSIYLHTISNSILDPVYYEKCVAEHLCPSNFDYCRTEVDELEKEHYWEDEYGVRYSLDGRKVLGSKDSLKISDYIVREGTQIICDQAFQSRDLHSITIPNSIISIGRLAFANNDRMEYCNIPSSVSHIANNNPWGGCFNIKQMDCQSPLFVIDDGILYSNNFQVVYGFIYWHPKVSIHPKTKRIAGNAFWSSHTNYDSLIQSINLSNVEQIGIAAFFGCTSANIYFSSELKEIGENAFYGCQQIQSINLDKVKIISNNSFKGCERLKEITLSNKLEIIHDNAFSECKSLETIKISTKTFFISDNSFHDCTALKEVIVDDKNPYFCDIDGVLYNKATTKLIIYPPARTETEYIIPSSVCEISDEAFANCKSIESIKCNNVICRIGKNAFKNCPNLTKCSIELTENSDMDSLWNLGGFLFTLQGADENTKEQGFTYITKSATIGQPKAQLYLAKCFKYGWHNKIVDDNQYIYWLELAASIDDEYEAKFLMGVELSIGKKTSQDYLRAYNLFVSLEEAGFVAAFICRGKFFRYLGLFYEQGIIVNRDFKKASEYYKKGTGWGDPYAEYDLAHCYEKGLGLNRDLQKAKELYQKAKEHNHRGAEEAVERMERLIQEQLDKMRNAILMAQRKISGGKHKSL